MKRSTRFSWTRWNPATGGLPTISHFDFGLRNSRCSQLDFTKLWDFLGSNPSPRHYGDYNEDGSATPEDLALVLKIWGEPLK